MGAACCQIPCAPQNRGGDSRLWPPTLSLSTKQGQGCPRAPPDVSASTLPVASGLPQPPMLTCCHSRVDHSVLRACRNRSGSWPGGQGPWQGLCCGMGPLQRPLTPPQPTPRAPHGLSFTLWPEHPTAPSRDPWPCHPVALGLPYSAHWGGLPPHSSVGSPGPTFWPQWANGLRVALLRVGRGHQTARPCPGQPTCKSTPTGHNTRQVSPHSPRSPPAHVWPLAPPEAPTWSQLCLPCPQPPSWPPSCPHGLAAPQLSPRWSTGATAPRAPTHKP